MPTFVRPGNWHPLNLTTTKLQALLFWCTTTVLAPPQLGSVQHSQSSSAPGSGTFARPATSNTAPHDGLQLTTEDGGLYLRHDDDGDGSLAHIDSSPCCSPKSRKTVRCNPLSPSPGLHMGSSNMHRYTCGSLLTRPLPLGIRGVSAPLADSLGGCSPRGCEKKKKERGKERRKGKNVGEGKKKKKRERETERERGEREERRVEKNTATAEVFVAPCLRLSWLRRLWWSGMTAIPPLPDCNLWRSTQSSSRRMVRAVPDCHSKPFLIMIWPRLWSSPSPEPGSFSFFLFSSLNPQRDR